MEVVFAKIAPGGLNFGEFGIPEFYSFYLIFIAGVFIACGLFTAYHAIKIHCIQRRKNTEEDELKEIIFNSYDDYGYKGERLTDLKKYKI